MLALGVRVARGPDWIWYDQGKNEISERKFIPRFKWIHVNF